MPHGARRWLPCWCWVGPSSTSPVSTTTRAACKLSARLSGAKSAYEAGILRLGARHVASGEHGHSAPNCVEVKARILHSAFWEPTHVMLTEMLGSTSRFSQDIALLCTSLQTSTCFSHRVLCDARQTPRTVVTSTPALPVFITQSSTPAESLAPSLYGNMMQQNQQRRRHWSQCPVARGIVARRTDTLYSRWGLGGTRCDI